MISVDEALERILGYVSVLEPQEQPILQALGQVLAEDVVSPFSIPPLDNTAMDGYAVQAASTAGASPSSPVELEVTGELAAGYVTRQAEITLLADEATALGNSPRPDYQHTWGIATIDTTTFPAGTTFTLNLAGIKGASSYCFRLAEPLGMTEDKLESIARAAINDGDGAISFSPVEVTYDEALGVLRLAL